MRSFILSLLVLNLLLFKSILTSNTNDEIDDNEEFAQDKRIFANHIEDQREYSAILDKRRYLARKQFEEHCKPKGKILERICPPLEQCLLTTNQIKQYSLRKMLEEKDKAHQFLHSYSRTKRFLFIDSNNNYNEKNINERRRRGLLLYEHYCESTDRLPRSCPLLDRCQCNDCEQ